MRGQLAGSLGGGGVDGKEEGESRRRVLGASPSGNRLVMRSGRDFLHPAGAVVLVLDVADDLLQDVLHGDQTQDHTAAVTHHCQKLALRTEELQGVSDVSGPPHSRSSTRATSGGRACPTTNGTISNSPSRA